MQMKKHASENLPFVSSEFFNELTRQWGEEAKVRSTWNSLSFLELSLKFPFAGTPCRKNEQSRHF
jgi:hypothetical protein